ncbi:MAG TPA: hypothetical protein VMT05_04590 [Terriglobales bacterium]|jgi:hypothetical protein|nr:hypothetical protein [Terriglobales bacterium]
MVLLGLALTFANIALLVTEFFRHRRAPLAAYGWGGLAGLIVAEGLMFRGVEPVATYFTPLAWTCYILLADAAVLAITGRSRLYDEPRRLALVALLSIPLWLIFEAYNLRLDNWTYVGVPAGWAGWFGYGWSFATITPGIFETADLVEAFGWFQPQRPLPFSLSTERGMSLFGLVCLVLPLVLPRHLGANLFALVWIGFVFLLDPINHRLRLPSLLGDLAAGRRGRLYSLLISGWVCGWLWEFWNYWAAAKWHYIFPMAQGWKIFEMPVPGYLGFLPFALECFVMYVTASWAMGRAAEWTLQIRNRRSPMTR